jgi:hypothetical protein
MERLVCILAVLLVVACAGLFCIHCYLRANGT